MEKGGRVYLHAGEEPVLLEDANCFSSLTGESFVFFSYFFLSPFSFYFFLKMTLL